MPKVGDVILPRTYKVEYTCGSKRLNKYFPSRYGATRFYSQCKNEHKDPVLTEPPIEPIIVPPPVKEHIPKEPHPVPVVKRTRRGNLKKEDARRMVLTVLRDKGRQSVNSLKEYVQYTNYTYLIRWMVHDGLVRVVRFETDRYRMLEITPKGHAWITNTLNKYTEVKQETTLISQQVPDEWATPEHG